MTYRSAACRIGIHGQCTEAEAKPSPPGVPVIYQSCDCPCHWQRTRDEQVQKVR